MNEKLEAQDKIIDNLTKRVAKAELKEVKNNVFLRNVPVHKSAKSGLETAVSYTHLTLPTNREV